MRREISVKLLVTLKRVEDWEIKIKVKPDGSGIETDQMKYVVNPFDEIAVEEALRLRDTHGGEVIVASIGVKDTQHQIRTALAMGADRGIHVIADSALDPIAVAMVLKKVVDDEKPDLVILGKQAVDDDQGQVGIILAEKLGWGQASFASKEAALDSQEEKDKRPGVKVLDGRATVVREVDGGVETLSLAMPCIITTDLRLNVPRYASLPGIMKAKKKEIKERQLAEFGVSTDRKVKPVKLEPPKERKAGVKVADVAALVDKLHSEAKVI
jgi:electron transfer flavoprotein beta subunit